MKPINIKEKFGKFDKQWHPHQIARVDNMPVILAKLKGEFVWHSHKNEDELFYVQKGTLLMRFRASTPLGTPNTKSVENSEHLDTEQSQRKLSNHSDTELSRGEEWSEIVHEGEMIVVPKGVEHCPTTLHGEEVHVLLIEQLNTKHTGEVVHEKTQTEYPSI